jgi:uncharacterized protein YciI
MTYIYLIRATREGFRDEMLPEEQEAMRVHFEYLKKLFDEGSLTLAGPCLDRAFGLAIYEAESDEEANRIAESDPAVRSGVMAVEVHPYKLSLWRPPA